MDIVFFGTPDWAVYSLDKIAKDKNFNILHIITKEDKPAGRGRKLSPPPVKKYALENNLENLLLQPSKIDEQTINTLKNKNIDLFVIVAYGKILPSPLLKISKYGSVNIHPSLLPKYRGPSPLQTQILNNEKNIGYTIMLIDEEMDHGPILYQEKADIDISQHTFQSLGDLLFRQAAEKLPEITVKYIKGDIKPYEQDHSRATFTKIIKKEDGLIKPEYDAFYIERMIRAYTPWPSAYLNISNNNPELNIKILEAYPHKSSHIYPPNTLYQEKGKLYLACADSTALEIKKLQPPSKPPVSAQDFINGYSKFISN